VALQQKSHAELPANRGPWHASTTPSYAGGFWSPSISRLRMTRSSMAGWMCAWLPSWRPGRLEQEIIRQALRRADANKNPAARLLGLTAGSLVGQALSPANLAGTGLLVLLSK